MMTTGKQLTLWLIATVIFATPLGVMASPVEKHLSNPQLVGEARLKVLLWDVFDATLHAENGSFDERAEFALTLSYLRSLKGDKIVEKTMEELRRLGAGSTPDTSFQQWQNQLLDIIPDVSKGTSITGVRTPEGSTLLYRDDEQIGSIESTEFTELFFSIWLGENTAEPELRTRLLGLDRTS